MAYGVLNGVWYTGGITYVMLGPMGLVPAAGIEGTILASVKQLGKVWTYPPSFLLFVSLYIDQELTLNRILYHFLVCAFFLFEFTSGVAIATKRINFAL